MKHPHEIEDDAAWFARADRFDGFDRGDLDNDGCDDLNEYDGEAGAVATPSITAEDGLLCCNGELLLEFGAGGDPFTCPWPMRSDVTSDDDLREQLAIALFGARECQPAESFPSSVSVVTLPDGTAFDIDAELTAAEERRRLRAG